MEETSDEIKGTLYEDNASIARSSEEIQKRRVGISSFEFKSIESGAK